MTAARIVPLKGSVKMNTGALLRSMGISPYQMLRMATLIVIYNTLNKIKELKFKW